MLAAGASYGPVAIAVTVVATVVIIALLAAAGALIFEARRLREQTDLLGREAQALLGRLDGTAKTAEGQVQHAAGQMDRVDGLIGSAEKISSTVGSASQLAQTAWAAPVIKVMAFGSGTAKATERFRRSGDTSARGRSNTSARRTSRRGS